MPWCSWTSRTTAPAEQGAADAVDPDAVRPDLADVVARHAFGLDEQRPEAVAKRHAAGRRTARENIEDLCDPGTFTEFGALAVAAQRQRRPWRSWSARRPPTAWSPAPGGSAVPAVAMSYDYTVLAGTQGLNNHRKTDRMLHVAEERGLPVVLFAEGGGGRPGDTDTTSVAGLNVTTFHRMARLSGKVPLVGIASGRCFAGNAALLGSCDVIIATPEANIGMGGPAMIEGGGSGCTGPRTSARCRCRSRTASWTCRSPTRRRRCGSPAPTSRTSRARATVGRRPTSGCCGTRCQENRRRAYDVRAAVGGSPTPARSSNCAAASASASSRRSSGSRAARWG